jgi:hypothetical protein
MNPIHAPPCQAAIYSGGNLSPPYMEVNDHCFLPLKNICQQKPMPYSHNAGSDH